MQPSACRVAANGRWLPSKPWRWARSAWLDQIRVSSAVPTRVPPLCRSYQVQFRPYRAHRLVAFASLVVRFGRFLVAFDDGGVLICGRPSFGHGLVLRRRDQRQSARGPVRGEILARNRQTGVDRETRILNRHGQIVSAIAFLVTGLDVISFPGLERDLSSARGRVFGGPLRVGELGRIILAYRVVTLEPSFRRGVARSPCRRALGRLSAPFPPRCREASGTR